MPRVSVIMPVFNAVKYLTTAVESILNQTYQDFELILIDDGSSDGSSQICEKYYEKDKRVVLIKKKNSGICGARNTGLNVCRGEIIAFCDHDDVYVKDYLEKAVYIMKKTNADIVRVSYEEQVIMSDKIKNVKKRTFLDEVYGLEGVLKNYLFFQLNISTVWNCLYKKNTVSNVIFDTSMRFGGEDICFNINILNQSIKIASISDILYVHYKRYGQSASSKFNENRLDSFNHCMKIEREFFSKYIDWTPEVKMITNSQAFYLGGYLSILECTGEKLMFIEKREILKNLRNNDVFKQITGHKELFKFIDYGFKYTLMLVIFKLQMFSLMIAIMKIKKVISRN